MPNKEPPEKVSLRLYVDAGSLMEEDDQRGLAHFLEHMAFNRSGFNSPKLASFLIHKVYIKCLGACPEDLYSKHWSLDKYGRGEPE